MNVRSLVQFGTASLQAASVEAPRREAWALLAFVTGRSRAALMAASDEEVDPASCSHFEALVGRRAQHEPLAYILGEKEFWSLTFLVSPAVLIPRPDSETLVEAALDHLPAGRASSVLDLGTGSGCLLLAVLSERTQAFGVGVERSEAAVRLASRNAHRLGLEDRATFLVGDWGAALGGTFDLILCNPPYVAEGAMAGLAPDIVDHEPHAALAAGADGLAAHRRLAPGLGRLLGPGALAVLEVGQGQHDAVGALLEEAGLAVQAVRRDLAGIERCLMARPS